jgi:hypothetical protein
MATTAVVGSYTIMDIVNSYTTMDKQGQYLWAAKVMEKKCPLLRYLPFFPSNMIMTNVGSRVSYLPTPSTRRFNEGVAPTASHKTPFTDPVAMVEDWSEVDYALYKIQNNPDQWRQDEDKAKVEAMTQKMEYLFFYGSLDSDPASFNGLATRFNLSTRRPNGVTATPYNVMLNGGSGVDVESVWAIELGQKKVYGIYPANLPAGLQIEDKGLVTVNTNTLGSPKYMDALRTHFLWYSGLVVEDERCVQRLANIEVSGTDNLFDEDNLIKLLNQLPGGGSAENTVILATLNIKNTLDIRAKDKLNVNYTPDEVWGGNITRFKGVPVFISEILTAETAIA